MICNNYIPLRLKTYDSHNWERQAESQLSKTSDLLEDFSEYNRTPQTLPPTTTFEIPSYYVFTNGVYPATYPGHPNPPPPLPPATDVGRGFTLGPNQLAHAYTEINLRNNQRARVVVDFMYIVGLICEIDWNA